MARLALGWRGPRQPILGMVLCGEVASVGPAVRSCVVGDRVFGMNRHRFGTYAQFVSWPEDGLLTRTPVNVSDTDAAAITHRGLLALQLLRKANIRAGQRELAKVPQVPWARQPSDCFAAQALETAVCTKTNRDLVASLSATVVVDYTLEDFRERSERYDLILDAVGRRKSAAALRGCGRALMPGPGCLSVDDGTPKLRRDDLVMLADVAALGEINPVIDRTFALEDIIEAHTCGYTGHKRGNVVQASISCHAIPGMQALA